ncbi:MAG: tryptophan synthase subunit alpha [Gammaproteobacteria bacterium]|nr:MAG: tryptophan synthase subunit alpha [Gammaproteobacteria bacterium]
MNRINKRFENLRQQGRKALIPYVVLGDPARDVTLPVMHALVESGADIIELGVPFSDPTAEGPVIQKAHERALANGSSLRDALALVKQFRAEDEETPVLLMGYANPIERMGYDNFIKAAVDAGVDGVLTVDLPPEEAEEFNQHLKEADLENIFLLAPTSSDERQKMVTGMAGGFIYYVSLKGVTGAGHLDVDSVQQHVDHIRTLTELPVCVGFGIKDGASARAVAELSDGAVVGSVLVNRMATLAESGETDPAIYAGAVSELIAEMRSALDN